MIWKLVTDVLTWHFRRVPVPESLRRLLSRGGPVTLVTHTNSIMMEALLTALLRSAGAESPVRLSTATAQSTTPRITWSSVENTDLLARWHARNLRQEFSSVNLFHVRGPVKSHPNYLSGYRAMWRLFLGARFMFIIFGEPLTVAPIGSPKSDGRPGERLARILKLDFYRNHKVIRGTPLQPIQTQAAQILHGQDFERELRIIAQRSGKDLEQVRQQAFNEFYRMAANPRRIMYGLVAPIARFMLRRLFTNVKTNGIERFISAVREHPVVLVPMHRSHLDYVLLGTTLYHLNLNPPLVAAGVNLSFWPFGSIIRSLGGYFVKRDARHDRIHALLLRRYVQYLLKRGHLQEFFIEGGRSRSGRMRAPKVGLLNIMVEAFLKRARKDVLFVPVSLTYEQLIEDKVFGDENTGKSKQKEDLRALVKARSVFRKQYGEVIVTFGAPVSLSEFCATHHRAGPSPTGGTPTIEVKGGEEPDRLLVRPHETKPSDQRAIVTELAKQLTRTIRDNTHVTLTGLAHTALLNAPRYGLPRVELVRTINALAEVAAVTSRIHSDLVDSPPAFTDSLQRFLAGNIDLIDELLAGGIIHRSTVFGTEIYFIPGKKRFSAEFYKNSILHFLWLPSVATILELRDGIVTPEAIEQFRPIVGQEFILPPPAVLVRDFTRVLDQLVVAGLMVEVPGGYRTVPGRGELCSPATLLAQIESHLWLLLHLQAFAADPPTPPVEGRYTVSGTVLTKRLMDEFRASNYLGRMTRTEAASQTNIQAVIDTLTSRKLLFSQGEGSKREYSFPAPSKEELKFLLALQELLVRHLAEQALGSSQADGAGDLSAQVQRG